MLVLGLSLRLAPAFQWMIWRLPARCMLSVWSYGSAVCGWSRQSSCRQRGNQPTPAAITEMIEGPFSHHARIATLLVGASGFYMVQRFDLWDRFKSAEF